MITIKEELPNFLIRRSIGVIRLWEQGDLVKWGKLTKCETKVYFMEYFMIILSNYFTNRVQHMTINRFPITYYLTQN